MSLSESGFLAKVMKQKFLSFTLLLLTLSIGVLLGTLLNTGVKAKDGPVAPGARPLKMPEAEKLQGVFAELAKMADPSVVNISSDYIPKQVSSKGRSQRALPQSPGDGEDNGMQDFMKRFFGGPGGSQQQPEEQRGTSLGSGVVVDSNGYIITNNHVIDKATRIQVKFNNDPTDYDAKLIGTDPLADIAVIKVEKTGLIPIKIGNSDGVQVGDWSVAIGSPFGIQGTVTAGIISAKGRIFPGEQNSNFQHFLQTDAAINPGNSGGPLLNIKGEVIGINTQIATRTGGYQGIGFAVPIKIAVQSYNQIISNGKVTRGSIGIQFRESKPELLKAYGATHGVFVGDVTSGGPAEKAGLKAEDIIEKVNGNVIKNGEDLIDVISTTSVGTNVNVEYLRGGKTMAASVTVADRAKLFAALNDGSKALQDDNASPEGESAEARFGIGIRPLTGRLKETSGLKEGGVVVASVEPGSFGEDIGLAQGDVITAVNRKPVVSLEDFQKVQKTLHTGDAVALRVLRNAQLDDSKSTWQTIFLAGTVPASGQ